MFPGDAAKAELRQGCREQGGWAEFLRSKLMCDLGSRGLGAHTASWRQGLLPGSQIRLVLPGISASCTQGAATASNPLEESERSLGKPIPRSCHGQDGRIDSQMTASATQPARLVCHTVSLLAGRNSPKVPPRCHVPRVRSIPVSLAGQQGGAAAAVPAGTQGGQEGRGDRLGEQRSQTCWGCLPL